MKLLILNCSREDGAADALREAAGHRGISCEVADPAAVRGGVFAGEENAGQLRAQRLLSAAHRYGQALRRLYPANEKNANQLSEAVQNGGYDAVLCCDRFSTEAMLSVRALQGGKVPCYALLTDYTGLPTRRAQPLDGYFIPHEALTQTLVEEGIPPERIYPTGVPVARRYGQRRTKAEARSALGIDKDRRVYLIAAEGMRYGDVTGLCDALCGAQDCAYVVYVLVERKNPVRSALERRYEGSEHVCIVTKPRRAELYLQSADVALLTPGGIESTEAAVAGVPLVHLLSAREAERQTARFFSQREMSLICQSISDAAAKARRLAEETAVAARMVQRQARDAYGDAADRILDRLCSGAEALRPEKHSI